GLCPLHPFPFSPCTKKHIKRKAKNGDRDRFFACCSCSFAFSPAMEPPHETRQADVQPPSTVMTAPLTYRDSSDARNSANPAISSGLPARGLRGSVSCMRE